MSDYVEGVEETFEVGVSTLAPGHRPAVAPAEYARKLAEQRDGDAKRSRERATGELIRQLQATQSGTAGFREDGIELWAWCGNVNAGCDDTQSRVAGVRITQARTYRDGGDDGPNADRVEKSWTEYDWADPDDATCKRCGERRHIDAQARPTYVNESGFDQRGLLKLARKFAAGQQENGTVVQSAQPVPQSPLDALGYRLAQGQIQIEEFRELRAALVEVMDSTTSIEKAAPLPVGIRQRGERYQARLNKSETPDGEGERPLGSFATLEEAVAARREALS